MGSETRIEWADHTFNPWRGCSRVHAGCENCYAERMSARNPSVLGVWGDDGTRVVAAESHWRLPEKWDMAAFVAQREADHEAMAATPLDQVPSMPCPLPRPRVFCASLADVFEDWRGECLDHAGCAHYTSDADPTRMVRNEQAVGCDMDGYHYTTLNDVRRRLFDMIDRTPYLDWLLLTKRPANIWPMWPGGFRSNVWLYVSASDQETLDAMVPPLFEARDLSPVLGLSLEPLLGPVDLGAVLGGLNHVIVGGESGPCARPCRVEWIRSVVRQCRAAGVPVFVKQLGSHPVVSLSCALRISFGSWNEAMMLIGEGERYRSHADSLVRWQLKDAKGGDPAEWPDDLRVRELPDLRLTVPLLRRWTDQTPVTPEALEREGWQEYQYTGHPCVAWRYRKQVDAERCLRCAMASGGDAPGISCWYTGGFDETAQIAEVRTMGQLNMIVDAIQGVK